VRDRLVDRLREAGIVDESTLNAIRVVPRHLFIDEALASRAYEDTALPIGHGQTISQPFIVALMTELLDLAPEDAVLEIGTGCGYQAAVLAELACQVYSVEVIPELAAEAKERLVALGYDRVSLRVADGYGGWPEHAPFDAIIVTAGAPDVPDPLLAQLKPVGRMVIPVDRPPFGQMLVRIVKDQAGRVRRRDLLPVAFVPFTRR
jgi:protein-L-isoaspartate(D-aspartate) O-methyltransferase